MKNKIKLHTVNVVEVVNDAPFSLRAFADNPKGNHRAEKMFAGLVMEHNADDGVIPSSDDLDKMIEDGVYDDECGYQLFLIHST